MDIPPPARLIIVDDEIPLMKALCDTLNEQGYVATGFSSGSPALEALRAQDFDLLLSDLMMPEMNGITLLQSALKIRPDLVGIIMTGEGTIATAVEAMKTGALDFILKPFKLSAILPVLERALAVRRLRLQNAALELAIKDRTAQLESANKELEAFSYSVSHDLRAPLRHIAGFGDILTNTETLSEKGRRNVDKILQAAERMGRLIDELLEFSRMGRVEMRSGVVDLEQLREEVIAMLAPDFEKRRIEWNNGALPRAQGDASMVRQVLQNLISNAAKYSSSRDPAIIEIGCCAQSPEELTYFVRDNGVGFDMKFADKLFGVFQRMHSQEQFEGTGVGLANVRRIIMRHGGRTWAEAKINEGAAFYFTLPPATNSVLPV